MKASVVLSLVGLQASLVAAGFDEFKFYSKCSASSSSELWSSLDECSTALRAQVTKTCNAKSSFTYCACDWGTSFVSTCLTLVCPTDVASSYLAADPAKRKTDCPAILTGGSGFGSAEPTAAATPGSGTAGGSSPTNTAAGGATAASTAGAASLAMPIAGGLLAGVVGGFAVLL